MKKFLNAPGDFVRESLEGFVAAHGQFVKSGTGNKFICRQEKATNKVAVISGGGAGHEPMHMGFVGKGMLDAACTGALFTSPTPDQMLAAAAETDVGMGVLFLVKNYDGDVMNFEMACEMYPGNARFVVLGDDVAMDAVAGPEKRRGVAGTLIIEKIIGAAAEKGLDLEELVALARNTASATRSIGVALESGTSPRAGRPGFTLTADKYEFGVGIHGEPGSQQLDMCSADAIIEKMVDHLFAADPPEAKRPVLLFVNGFGGTTASELYLMQGLARRAIKNRGIEISRSLTGSYVTSLDMAGCSITLLSLSDEILEYWDAEVCTPVLNWG